VLLRAAAIERNMPGVQAVVRGGAARERTAANWHEDDEDETL